MQRLVDRSAQCGRTAREPTYARERLTYVRDGLGLLGLTRPKKHGELLGG